jgi:hypothetical protein
MAPSVENMQAYSMPITPAPTTSAETALHHGLDPGAPHGAGNIRETEDAVGVDDGRAIDRYVRGYRGHGPRGDHDPLRADQRRGSLALDLDGLRINERGVALEDVHAVARELRAVDVVLFLDHVVASEHQVLDGDGLLDAVGVAVEPTLLEAREVLHGLAQLRRDGPRIDADTAHACEAFHDGDAAAELGSLDRGVAAHRAAAEHDELVLHHGVVILAPRGWSTRRRGNLGLPGVDSLAAPGPKGLHIPWERGTTALNAAHLDAF